MLKFDRKKRTKWIQKSFLSPSSLFDLSHTSCTGAFLAAAVNLVPLRMSVERFVLSSSFSRSFLSHLMSLLSCLCRSKEQRENHREQLLSPLVKQQKRPSALPSHIHTYTHIDIHTSRSLLPVILSAVGLE